MKAIPRTLLALGVVFASITLPGAYRVYLNSREPEAELVIPAGDYGSALDPAPPAVSPPGVQMANASPVTPATLPAEVIVHVAGSVRKPGLYHFKVGERTDDAVRAAGGAAEDANLDGVNLAAKLEDGQQLYVPKKGELAASSIQRPAAAAKGGKTAAAVKPAKLQKGQGTVNLNTATKEQLMTLPGIGDSYAQRILDYRKANGGFKELEQLMDVSGIGEKKLEKLRPFLRLK
jgi:competence protein ComEA